jgi:hypothetical protein
MSLEQCESKGGVVVGAGAGRVQVLGLGGRGNCRF